MTTSKDRLVNNIYYTRQQAIAYAKLAHDAGLDDLGRHLMQVAAPEAHHRSTVGQLIEHLTSLKATCETARVVVGDLSEETFVELRAQWAARGGEVC